MKTWMIWLGIYTCKLKSLNRLSSLTIRVFYCKNWRKIEQHWMRKNWWKRKKVFFFPLFLVGFKITFNRSICFCFRINFFMSYENIWRVLFSDIIVFSLLPFAFLPLTFDFSYFSDHRCGSNLRQGQKTAWDVNPKWLHFKNLFLELPTPHQWLITLTHFLLKMFVFIHL